MNVFVKWAAVSAAGIALFAGGASTAHAQATIGVQKPIRVKIGAFFPTDGDVKDTVGNGFISGGLSYDFSKTTATNPTIFNVYADYTEKKKDDAKLSIFGIGLGARFLFAPAINVVGQPYAELGLGYYNVKAEAGGEDDNEGKIGGKAALGYQLNNGLFGEFEYTLISEIDDTNPSGFRASLGYRF